MQTVAPVDIYVENEWRENSNVKKDIKPSNHKARIRTRVLNKPKSKKINISSHIPKQVVIPKLVRSRSISPNRGSWIPPPGRSTKGQKISWQSPKSRLEINPVTEIIIDDNESLNTDRSKQNTTINSYTNTHSTETNEKLMNEIQNYEKRIQGLIDGIGILKERIHKHDNQEQTDQLRSDIDSSLYELEQNYTQHTRKSSRSPIRNNNRSSSLDEKSQKRNPTSKVSFQDDLIIEKQKSRSTTPVQGPIYLNPDREQLLILLTESENDITQITKELSSVKDILAKLKLDDQTVSIEIEELYQYRNKLLHLIEQFEHSNSKLKEYLHHQYHLEAENGILYGKYDELKTHIYEIDHENQYIRRLLLDRENDNIKLLTELERIRTETIGFDTMKTSLEHNRAHLQRELYTKEGEINRLQCALRSLERDLQRSRYQCNNMHRSIKSTPMFSTPNNSSSPIHVVTKSKVLTIERLQSELNERDKEINELKKQLYENKTNLIDDTNTEIIHLRTQLQQTEQLSNEYKAQLHTQTLKTSANNSRNHLSEIELEKIRTRLQKRIEELEPLPELLKQEELKNEKLQKQNNDLQKRLSEQLNYLSQNRNNDNHLSSPDDEYRNLQRKFLSLKEQNEKLLQTLDAKDEELRIARLNTKSYELTSINKNNDTKIREISRTNNTYDFEQQITKLRLEYNQLKREKDDIERQFKSQLNDLKTKLEQSNNTNRTMQNYLNSLKTTYVTLFNDSIPISLIRSSTK